MAAVAPEVNDVKGTSSYLAKASGLQSGGRDAIADQPVHGLGAWRSRPVKTPEAH